MQQTQCRPVDIGQYKKFTKGIYGNAPLVATGAVFVLSGGEAMPRIPVPNTTKKVLPGRYHME